MFYNERDVIDIYEKRYTLQDILWMKRMAGFYLHRPDEPEI